MSPFIWITWITAGVVATSPWAATPASARSGGEAGAHHRATSKDAARAAHRRPRRRAARPSTGRASGARTRKRVEARRPVRRTGSRSKARCRRRGDRLIPLKYLQGGSVWIPSEARCGGRYPVIVLLHGNNTARKTVMSLGGGRRLERWARRYLDGRHIEPVILAEPIHFGACANAERRKGLPYLFTGRFDFKQYRARLERLLRRRGIRPKSWSFIGHSGAACCLGMGMFSLKKVWPRIRIWASADGCYSGDRQASAVRFLFEGESTRVYNACRGWPAYRGYRDYERTLLGSNARETRCDHTYYERCHRHPSRPWYSFTTHFKGPEKHSKVAVELFKTLVFHQFPSARRIAARKRSAARKRLAARKRARRVRQRRSTRRPRPGNRQTARGPTRRASSGRARAARRTVRRSPRPASTLAAAE